MDLVLAIERTDSVITCTIYNEQKQQATQGEQSAKRLQIALIQKLVQEWTWS